MNFLVPIAFIDTLPMMALLNQQGKRTVAQFDNTSRLELRDKQGRETETLSGPEPWKGAKIVLNSCRKLVGKLPGMTDEPGHAFLELLPPGTSMAWDRLAGEYHEKHERFHLPLSTNPFALMYAANEAMSPPPGQLLALAPKVLWCAVNHGEHPRYHLVADFRKAVANG